MTNGLYSQRLQKNIEQKLIGWKGVILVFGVLVSVAVMGLLWWLSRGDWIYPEQINSTQLLSPALSQNHVLGQTFVAKQAGLQGIGIKIMSENITSPVTLRIRLYSNPDGDDPIVDVIQNVMLDEIGKYVYFQFPPQQNSRYHYYYFTIDILTAKKEYFANLYGADLNTYLDGSAYADGVPVDTQLAFHLNYDRLMMLAAIFGNIIRSIPEALAALVMLLVPGSALLIWSRPKIVMDGIEWIAVAVGISLSIIPVLMAYLRYVPLTLNSHIVWGGYGVVVILFVVGVWQHRPIQWQTVVSFHYRSLPVYLAFIVVFLLSLAVRLQVVSGVDIPLWGDSYHHTIISQIIVDNGKVVSNWAPYAPLKSLNYHFGFHTMVAIFHWLTGLNVPKSVIFFGQILNTMAVLMAYLLGRRFGGNAWVGVFAALITGLLSKYPMYYVNWGRYTQLAGQVLLPVLMVLTWELLRKDIRSWRLAGLNILLVAALFLTHYRVILFYPAFVVALLLIRWYQLGWRHHSIMEDIFRLGMVAIGGGALISLRVWELIGGRLWVISVATVQLGESNRFISQVYNAVPSLFEYFSPLIVVLGGLGFALGLWKRNLAIVSIGFWWLLLLLVANPQLIFLPGTGLVTNFTVFIGAYLVFSLLSSYILGAITISIIHHHHTIQWIALVGVLVLAVWGNNTQVNVLNPKNMLVTSADLRAMQWVRENVPIDAKFLVNSQFSYGGTTVVGTDAGWWLPYLTLHRTYLLPMLYQSETIAEPIPIKKITQTLMESVQPSNANLQSMRNKLIRFGYNYIYIGQQRGTVGDDVVPLLTPINLEATLAPKLVYAQDGIRIYNLQ